MPKQTIAIDIDDVLADSAKGVVAFSNKRWGTNLTIEDYKEHWGAMWGIDHAETHDRSAVINASGLAARHDNFEEALPVLKKLAKRYRLIVVTSRRADSEKDTRAWLDQHYGELFDDVVFSGFYDNLKHHGEGSYRQTKEKILLANKADFILDDQLKHCAAAQKVGIQGLLFGDYPWNRDETLPAGVIRLTDWPAVGGYFDARG